VMKIHSGGIASNSSDFAILCTGIVSNSRGVASNSGGSIASNSRGVASNSSGSIARNSCASDSGASNSGASNVGITVDGVANNSSCICQQRQWRLLATGVAFASNSSRIVSDSSGIASCNSGGIASCNSGGIASCNSGGIASCSGGGIASCNSLALPVVTAVAVEATVSDINSSGSGSNSGGIASSNSKWHYLQNQWQRCHLQVWCCMEQR